MCLYCEKGDSSGGGLKRYVYSSEITDVHLKVIIIIIMVIIMVIIIIDTIHLKRFVCSNVIHHHIIIIIIIDHYLNYSPARAQCYHRHHTHQTCCLVV